MANKGNIKFIRETFHEKVGHIQPLSAFVIQCRTGAFLFHNILDEKNSLISFFYCHKVDVRKSVSGRRK